jgi:tetratricopeptide (TPR) repeat protein
MKSHFLTRLNATLLGLALLTFSTAGFPAGGNYSSSVDLEPIMDLLAQGKYQTAIDMLHDALDLDPDNPDVMSLLGYSYRKTQNYENAQTFYEWALRAEPDHRGANEYLFELNMETKKLDKAVEQLQILDNLCRTNCKEYSKLKQMIDSFQQSASSS